MGASTIRVGPFPWVFRWRREMGGVCRMGHSCAVLVRGARNSALVEFADGWRACVSRNALRKRPDAPR